MIVQLKSILKYHLKKGKSILAIVSVITLFFLGSCNSSGDRQDEKPEPNLMADREAPLGWVYLRTYPNNTFEFILTGLRDRTVYPGTYRLSNDTIIFTYSDSIPKLNSFKAIITERSVNYLDGTYSESLQIRKNDLLILKKKDVSKKNPTISPNQAELNEALNNIEIDDYYKDIYRQEKLISADDNKMLSIADSLFTSNPKTDLFYFIVFTKSMNGSDGFYSEAVGLSAFNFLNQKTEQFADYFNIAPKLNEKDMINWASFIYGEIQISREGEELKAINDIETRCLENIKEARKEYKAVIEEFFERIKTLHNLSKN